MTDFSHDLILAPDEAARRLLLLLDLQIALAELGIHSVLARNHRLVLRWHSAGPFGPSGLTDPRLHIFTPAGITTATTNGTDYHLATGHDSPATDPFAAAALIRDPAATRELTAESAALR